MPKLEEKIAKCPVCKVKMRIGEDNKIGWHLRSRNITHFDKEHATEAVFGQKCPGIGMVVTEKEIKA